MTSSRQDLGSQSIDSSGHLLARNVFFNIIGQTLPIAIAFFSIPALIHSLGTEKFGVLALAWVLAGYFNLFDLGLGRAVVRIVVQKIPLQNFELSQAVWAAFVVASLFGIAGGTVLFFAAEWLTVHFFAVNDQLHAEVVKSLQIMGIVIPFVVSSTIFRGTLEAFQKFDLINLVQVPIGAMTYLLPLIMSKQTDQLPWIIGTLVFARLTLWLALGFLSLRCIARFPKSFRFGKSILSELLSFGFWISTSNIIQPFLSYLDRLLIGSMISMIAVAYYTAPMEIVLKFWILPGAVISVIYPAFTANRASIDVLRTLYFRSTRFLIIVIAPVSFLVCVFAEEILRLWISSEYAHESATVLSILAIGILINCIGFVPAAFLQAIGRPSVPAKLHVIEFPIYAAVLFWSLKTYGVVGAAYAWTARVFVDSAALHHLSLSKLNSIRGLKANLGWFVVLASAGLLLAHQSFNVRISIVVPILLATPAISWFFILAKRDQAYLLDRLFKTRRIQSNTNGKNISRVGIAMAVYNPDNLMFERQLKSLIRQTYSNWVCVMTVDSDLRLLLEDDRIANLVLDPRFQLIPNEKRLGATKNFERSVSIVADLEIDAVAFCDQDDVWFDEKLEVLVRALENKPPLALVHSDMRVVKHSPMSNIEIAQSAWIHEDRRVEGQSGFHFLVRNCVTGASSLIDIGLVRLYREIPNSFRYHDQWFALAAALEGGVYPIHRALYDYVQHDANEVGIVRYQGFFYRPPGVSWRQLIRRATESWSSSVEMIRDCEKRGMKISRFERWWGQNRIVAAFALISMAIAYLILDPSFSRACFIKAMGRFCLCCNRQMWFLK